MLQAQFHLCSTTELTIQLITFVCGWNLGDCFHNKYTIYELAFASSLHMKVRHVWIVNFHSIFMWCFDLFWKRGRHRGKRPHGQRRLNANFSDSIHVRDIFGFVNCYLDKVWIEKSWDISAYLYTSYHFIFVSFSFSFSVFTAIWIALKTICWDHLDNRRMSPEAAVFSFLFLFQYSFIAATFFFLNLINDTHNLAFSP